MKEKTALIDPYELAKNRMVDLLSEFPPISASEVFQNPNIHSQVPYALVAPQNHPLLIGRGTTALVFELLDVCKEWDWTKGDSNKKTYMVGKVCFYDSASSRFYIKGLSSGLKSGSLEQTVASLDSLGIKSPKMLEHREEINGRPMYFTIMRDLRKGERFNVEDADGFDFSRLRNGDQLKKDFDRYCKLIEDSQGQGYDINLEGHRNNQGIGEAIRHIFVVQYLNKVGRLVVADLDHLRISKN